MKSTVLDSTKATSQADKLARFRRSLKTTRELQEAKLTSGVGGIDTFVEEVEGDWLESWGEEEKDKAKEEEIDPLAGKDLLQKIKVSSHLSRRETAKQSGFYSAVLAAKGLSLETGEAKNKQGHEPTFRINVNRNGQLVIDSIYVEKMGLTPGDELEITLGRKYIHLKKVESTQQLNKK
jgi:AbrB-like transcriptional regulator